MCADSHSDDALVEMMLTALRQQAVEAHKQGEERAAKAAIHKVESKVRSW